MTEVVVHLDGLVVGPEQWLVLCARRPLDPAEIETIRSQIPEALYGRVLVVDQMTGYVVEARA